MWQTEHHHRKRPSVSNPDATSLKRARSPGSSGLVDLQASYHDGPHRPQPAPALAVAPVLLTGQAHPEPHDDRKHQKENRATDLRCPPAAVGRGHRVMLGACGQPTAQATQTCHRRTRQRRGLAPPRVRHSSGASWLAGGSEDGKRNGEKTTHNLRDTHWAFLPGGPFSTVRPSVECGVGSRSRQRCSYTTLLLGTPPGPALGMWPAPAQGLGLQVFLSLLYMFHHIGSLSSRLDCPSCEEDLAGGPQGAPSLS